MALESALSVLGGPAPADIPDTVLDNLKQTESSGDAYAVNKDTGAMGAYQFLPSTVAMLHKQGIGITTGIITISTLTGCQQLAGFKPPVPTGLMMKIHVMSTPVSIPGEPIIPGVGPVMAFNAAGVAPLLPVILAFPMPTLAST